MVNTLAQSVENPESPSLTHRSKLPDSENNKNKSKWSFVKSELGLIILLPALVLFISYGYELGYALTIKIPIQLIQPANTRVIAVAVGSLCIAIAIFLVTVMLLTVCLPLKDKKQASVIFVFGLFVFMVYSILVYTALLDYLWIGILFAAPLSIGGLLVSARKMFGSKTPLYMRKIVITAYRMDKNSDIALGEISKIIGLRNIIISLLILALFVYSVSLGGLEARISTFYSQLTYQGNPYLLLRTYGDNVVLGRYEDNHLTGDIVLVSQQDLHGITIKPYNGGPPQFKLQTNPTND
ncbi:hypothetical protein JD969_13195 [Planctomycetota bacterium]|nr:hypothetical protein JD969_13195 [Planctomycetota bacterium]